MIGMEESLERPLLQFLKYPEKRNRIDFEQQTAPPHLLKGRATPAAFYGPSNGRQATLISHAGLPARIFPLRSQWPHF
jgi:hypothetical protein